MNIKNKKILLLFDVDGTLTKPRNKIENNIINYLKDLNLNYNINKNLINIAAVGGSDYTKIKEQLGESINYFKYIFSENGLVSYVNKNYHNEDDLNSNHLTFNLFHQKRLNEYLGEDKLMSFINYVLNYIADLDVPIKRGTFIEYRTGMLNCSPIGRNCSQEEREEFVEYNKNTKVLEKFKDDVEKHFSYEDNNYRLKFSIGGQISFDVVPLGWDKSYCLQFVDEEYKDNIYFFGDKIYDGGNDYEVAIDKRVKSYFKTTSPEVTIHLVEELIKGII